MNYLNLLWFLPGIIFDVMWFINSRKDSDNREAWLIINAGVTIGVFTAIGLTKIF